MPPDNAFGDRAPGDEISGYFESCIVGDFEAPYVHAMQDFLNPTFFHRISQISHLSDEIYCEKHIAGEHGENGRFQKASTKR